MIREKVRRFNIWIDSKILIPLYRKIQKDSPVSSRTHRFCDDRIQNKYKYREKV